MLRVWIIDCAVFSSLNSTLVHGRFCALKKCIDFKVSVGQDEGQVEAFGGKAIAHKTNFDRRHVDTMSGRAVNAGECPLEPWPFVYMISQGGAKVT